MFQVLRDWAWLDHSQWLEREKLASIQARKLRSIVNHAYGQVPFYKKLYNEWGLEPGRIRDAADIQRLPLLGRQELARVPLKERTALDADLKACIPITTSGSTGTPITILDDSSVDAYLEALYLRFLWACGVRPLDKTCRVKARSAPFPNERLGLWSTFRNLMRHKRLAAADDIGEHVKFYLSWKPDLLTAFPSYYRVLTRFLEQAGQVPVFKRVVTEAELLDQSTREHINQILHAEVFDFYGLNEVGGVAWECPTHTGYHVNADSLLVEFLRDGEAVSSGEQGQVYVTSLQKMATPILRYATGDVATPIDDECPCGRGLPLIKDIQGRIVDFILTRDGRYLSPYLVTRMLEHTAGVQRYKVIQNRDYSIELQLKISCGRNETTIRELKHCCRDAFPDTPVSINIVDHIENEDAPKFRLVESHLTRSVESG